MKQHTELFIDTTFSRKPSLACSSGCSFFVALLILICIIFFSSEIDWQFKLLLLFFAGAMFFQGIGYRGELKEKGGRALSIDLEGFHNLEQVGDVIAWSDIQSIQVQRRLPSPGSLHQDAGKVETLLILEVGQVKKQATLRTLSWIGRYSTLVKLLDKEAKDRSITFNATWYVGSEPQAGNPPY